MKRRALLLAWIALTLVLCVRADFWDRPLAADNRLYFFMAERAAAGVPPHVSAPDVKNQLSTLVDGASIFAGRSVGLNDIRSGRLAAIAILAAGVCGVGLLVLELGGSAVAASAAAISTLSFGALVEHAAIGFNPKILLFALIAWTHLLIARGRWRDAGAAAAGALLCWQPAVAVGAGMFAGALVQSHRLGRLVRLTLGASVVVFLYEAYFAWHGALLPQLYQACLLPLGSAQHPMDVMDGLRFVTSWGTDHHVVPAFAFAIFVVERAAWLLRRKESDAGSMSTAAATTVSLIVAGLLCVVFTIYDHQGEPDRFLLSAYFSVAIGIVAERGLGLLDKFAGRPQVLRAEGALIALLLTFTIGASRGLGRDGATLESQLECGRIVRLYAETYGNVWAFGCSHLLGLAHLTNYHPLDYLWDDLDAVFDSKSFTPAVGGRLPDVILAGRHIPGRDVLARQYTQVAIPALAAEHVRLYVRNGERVEIPGLRSDSKRGPGRKEQRASERRRTRAEARRLKRNR